jgi:hypothetical protein
MSELTFSKHKGKTVPVHNMMAHGGVKVQLYSFLTSIVDREVVSFMTQYCIPRGRATSTH